MLRWVVGSSLKFRFIVVALAAGLMFFGRRQLQRHARVDVFPEFAPPRGGGADTRRSGCRRPRWRRWSPFRSSRRSTGFPGLDEIRSKSVEQLSSIEMIFEPGTDLLERAAAGGGAHRRRHADLPTWASPPFMIQPLSATSRVMKIGLSSHRP